MTPRFCGNCGAPVQPGSGFCVMCGTPLQPGPPEASTTGPWGTPPVAPAAPQPPIPAPSYWPGTPYAPPPARKKSRVLLVAIVVGVVAVIAVVAVALLIIQPRAHFVDITKTGVSGNSMAFDVTITTDGASIGVDKLHVTVRSLQNGAEYDAVQYYNLDTIPAGETFTWSLDVLVDPYNLSSFTYEFALEVNGTQMDASTVT